VLAFVLWAALVDDPFGGEPIAVVATPAREAGSKKADEAKVAVVQAPSAQPAAAAPPTQTVTIIDGSSGKREEVQVAGMANAGQGPPIDKRLVENSRHGPLPKIATDGARPADVYAQPAKAAHGTSDAPRIALVVGRLGISTSSTAEAMAKLPAPVTLAFTPYASDVAQMAARARADGHEVLLQVPMEPFDYPDNDPGPQTLLTSLAPEQNIDRLHWLMSRFQGYVGITNYMGARFTASDQSVAAVLRETAKRGLIYVDDGTSQRSLAGQMAGANMLPFAKAEVVVDAVPTRTEIDKALARLETIARERGLAVGAATALPVTIERIARWTKSVTGRGIVLVPISTAVVKARSS
jgi:polysaccharide deacetylase 2 family uncharacterized protein YibQ